MGSKRVWLPVLLAVSSGLGACTTIPAEDVGFVTSPPVALDAYSWLDRADALLDAIESSPPDHSFTYADAQLFAWEVDGALIIEEPSRDGYALYIYEAGQRRPMFVRTPDFAAGFDRDELAVIYTRDGRVLTDVFQSDLVQAAWTLRERGGSLFPQRYSRSWDVDLAEVWASFEFVIDSQRRRWSDRWRGNRDWENYRRRSEAGASRAALQAERQRRREQAQLFRTWRDSGFAGPAPAGLSERFRDRADRRRGGGRSDRPRDTDVAVPPARPDADGATRPDRPRRDWEGTRPDRPRRDETGTRPDRPRRDEDGTRPDRPRRDEDGTRPDRPRRDDNGTRPDRPRDESGTRPDRPRRDETGNGPDRPREEEGSRPDRPRRDESGARPDRPRQEAGGTRPGRPRRNDDVVTPVPTEPERPRPDEDRPRRPRIERPEQPEGGSATLPAAAIEEEAARRRDESRRREREEARQAREAEAARQAAEAETSRQAQEENAREGRRLRAEEAQREAQAEQARQAQAAEEAERRRQDEAARQAAEAASARQAQEAEEARHRQAAAEAEAARQRQAASEAEAAGQAEAEAAERRRQAETERQRAQQEQRRDAQDPQ